jgi:hypothetical protein
MQTQKDNWAEQFKNNLRHHIKRINNWRELKLKHQDYRLNLHRQKIGTRTYIISNSTIVMVHDPDLY